MKINDVEGEWRLNINFLLVPPELIDQWKGKVSKTEWVLWAEWYNNAPSIWNLAYIDKEGNVRMFIYGSWDPLEREMRIIRMTCDKAFYTVRGDILKDTIHIMRATKEKFKAKILYFESDVWWTYLRKLGDGELRLSKAKIMEVI